MLKAIVLDTTPLGLVAKRTKLPVPGACRTWVEVCQSAGISIYVPEIADFEVRRELLRAKLLTSVVRLDKFNKIYPARSLPLTTAHMRRAAQLWADSRNAGFATADRFALDGDVILCAQALALGFAANEVIVATSNTKHIRRFIAAEEWENIIP